MFPAGPAPQVLARLKTAQAGLARLDLSSCRRITSGGVHAIVEVLSQLTRLSLAGCFHVDAAAAKAAVHKYVAVEGGCPLRWWVIGNARPSAVEGG